MKTIKYIIIAISIMLVFTRCELFDPAMLDQQPPMDITEEKIFSDYNLFKQYSDQAYSYIPGHLARMWSVMVPNFGDEMRTMTGGYPFNTGGWNGSNALVAPEIATIWTNSYAGIRKCNQILERIDQVPIPTTALKNRHIGEALFIRAFLYHELTKRWGDVPYINQTQNPQVDEIDIARTPYDTIVARQVADLDRISTENLLLIDLPDQDNGRASVGAARALKSRILLYAARPLHNPTNDIKKWEAAANAAFEVINMNKYALYSDYKNLFFQTTCSEIIMNRPRKTFNSEGGHNDFQAGSGGKSLWARFFASEGFGGWQALAITQNCVDRFEDANGFPLADSLLSRTVDPTKAYNPTTPYTNRDPRFKASVLYNGRTFANRTLDYTIPFPGQTGANGADRGVKLVNLFSYNIAKYWPESMAGRWSPTSTYLNYIFFRYGEILLNYAEAQNEVGGPESSVAGGPSVRQVLTDLRARVGQPTIPVQISGDKNTMRERIWNEFAVELCFEEHWWYDVLSWKAGERFFNTMIYRTDVYKKTSGSNVSIIYNTKIPFEQAVFKPYMHLYPIPDSEIFKSKNLINNPGW